MDGAGIESAAALTGGLERERATRFVSLPTDAMVFENRGKFGVG